MTPEDRELLQALRRQQAELQASLAQLDRQLAGLEARYQPELPPLPEDHAVPDLPPLPPPGEGVLFPEFPPLPPPVPEAPAGLGVFVLTNLLGMLALMAAAFWIEGRFHLLPRLGPWGELPLLGVLGTLLIWIGQRIERTKANGLPLGRTILVTGVVEIYTTLYLGAPVVIGIPWLTGLLLLWWSAYVLAVARAKGSQALALFALTLAYVTTATSPSARFALGADLLVAVVSALMLVRWNWAAPAFLSLLFTYAAELRRLIVDDEGQVILDTSRTLHFWPYASFLLVTWLIFTWAVTHCGSPTFRCFKRLAFLSLNNGALAALLVLTAFIAGYGHGAMGTVLFGVGFLLLIASRFVGFAPIEPDRVMASYAAQGLALVTVGIVVVFTETTRGALLVWEALLLGAAGAFADDHILKRTTLVAAFLGTVLLTWEMAVNYHHPWLIGFGGGLVMLLNAWWARRDLQNSPKARSTFVPATCYYCALAVTLIFTALCSERSEDALPPALALAALALTFTIYLVSLFELPPLAQIPLLVAQALTLFPVESGQDLPWWSTASVALVTVVMITWWSRQRVTRTGTWVGWLEVVYALALAGLTWQAVEPWVDPPFWMACACLLSLAYLIWGLTARVWSIALVGQVFLVLAVYPFFLSKSIWELHHPSGFTALLAVVTVCLTARSLHYGLPLFFADLSNKLRFLLRVLIQFYQLVGLAMLLRTVLTLVPAYDQPAAFLLLGGLFLLWNIPASSAYGIRCGLLFSLGGLWLYTDQLAELGRAMATFLTGLAFLGFLSQPLLLRRTPPWLITRLEAVTMLTFSAGAGWLFTTVWVLTRLSAGDLIMAWCLYALFLLAFGVLTNTRGLLVAGFLVVLASILQLGWAGFGVLSIGYKLVTVALLFFTCFCFFSVRLANVKRRMDAAPTAPPNNL